MQTGTDGGLPITFLRRGCPRRSSPTPVTLPRTPKRLDYWMGVVVSVLFHLMNVICRSKHRLRSRFNNNEILIKREPLVYTRAWRAVQKKKKKEEETGWDSTTAITNSSMDSTHTTQHSARTHTTQQVKRCNSRIKVLGVQV